MSSAKQKNSPVGLTEAIASQIIWGLLPLYWKLLSSQSALYSLSCRMVWCAIFILLLCAFVKRVHIMPLLKDKRALGILMASGLATSINWGIYIWAVSSSHILESSIGYYLLPLLTIMLGVIIFHERMSRVQIAASILAVLGVGFFIAKNGGDIWISLGIAFSFSIYGAIKKKGNYPALSGMAVESLLTGLIGGSILMIGVAVPALWDIIPPTPDTMAVYNPVLIGFLSIMAGVVTAVPLLLYSAAANKVTLVSLGFIQYIGPTLEMIIAVFIFGETFTLAHAVCLGLIWLGIGLVTLESFNNIKKLRNRSNKKQKHLKSIGESNEPQ